MSATVRSVKGGYYRVEGSVEVLGYRLGRQSLSNTRRSTGEGDQYHRHAEADRLDQLTVRA